MNAPPLFSRRQFLQGTAGIGTGLVVLGGAACNRGELQCTAVEGLSADEQQQRSLLKYAEPAPGGTRTCDTCAQYKPPAETNTCGGCTVIKGPIHPRGTCSVYVPRPA